MGALYICALLSSLLAFFFTITLLFMRKDGVSQLRMADRFDDSGQREPQLAWLNAAISQNSRTGRAYFDRARANELNLCRTSGHGHDTLLNGILEDIEKAVSLDPGISDAYRLRSKLLKDQGLLEGVWKTSIALLRLSH